MTDEAAALRLSLAAGGRWLGLSRTKRMTEHESNGFDPLRLDRQLCFPLYAATNLMQRLYRPLLTPLGLTYTQYLVLLLLWERKTASVGELRACLYLDAGTITPLLKRMERAGLVVRQRDGDDQRRVLIRLTGRSAALRKQAARIPAALWARIGIDVEAGKRLYSLTTILVEQLRHATLLDA
jgi:MarR family transcriptional regulator, organic hydroperoxide resistance regulator